MNVPTLKEEVDRKALEALEMIATDQHTGKITEAQYSYALTVLWASCAGIAGSDFSMMMEVAQQGKKDGSQYTRKYLRSSKGDVVKITNYHNGTVRYDFSLPGGEFRNKTYNCETPMLGKQKFQEIEDKLISNGFEEI